MLTTEPDSPGGGLTSVGVRNTETDTSDERRCRARAHPTSGTASGHYEGWSIGCHTTSRLLSNTYGEQRE